MDFSAFKNKFSKGNIFLVSLAIIFLLITGSILIEHYPKQHPETENPLSMFLPMVYWSGNYVDPNGYNSSEEVVQSLNILKEDLSTEPLAITQKYRYKIGAPGKEGVFIEDITMSPDKKRLAYVRWETKGEDSIIVYNLGSREEKRVTNPELKNNKSFYYSNFGNKSWSPDGRYFVYTVYLYGGPPVDSETSIVREEVEGIWLVDSEDLSQKRVLLPDTQSTADYFLKWHDDTKILYVEERLQGARRSDFVILDVGSGSKAILGSCKGAGPATYCREGHLTNDSKQVIYNGDWNDKEAFIFDLESQKESLIYDASLNSEYDQYRWLRNESLSPNGNYLYFQLEKLSGEGGNTWVGMVLNLTSKQSFELGKDIQFNGWSLGGEYLLYSVEKSCFVLNAETHEAFKLDLPEDLVEVGQFCN